jgi:cytoskeletal protein RodZ
MNEEKPFGLNSKRAKEISEQFKEARVSCGKTLKEMASTVKIREHYLSAMEDGRFFDLPPGLNGRGLIRVYARELRVPIEELEIKSNDFSSYEKNKKQNKSHYVGISEGMPYKTHVSPLNEYNAERIASTLPKEPVKVKQGLNKLSEPVSNVSKMTHSNSFIKKNTHQPPEDELALDILTPDVELVLGLSKENAEKIVGKVVKHEEQPKPSPVQEKYLPQTYVQNLENTEKQERFEQPKVEPDYPLSQPVSEIMEKFAQKQKSSSVEKLKKPLVLGSVAVVSIAAIVTLFVSFSGNRGSESEKAFVREISTPSPSVENPEVVASPVLSPSQEVAPQATPMPEVATMSVASGSVSSSEEENAIKNSATMNVLSAVIVQITIDSNPPESKTWPAGIHTLVFDKKADLLISDGSKVSFKHGNWDTGVLGAEGRKRKITLRSEELRDTEPIE